MPYRLPALLTLLSIFTANSSGAIACPDSFNNAEQSNRHTEYMRRLEEVKNFSISILREQRDWARQDAYPPTDFESETRKFSIRPRRHESLKIDLKTVAALINHHTKERLVDLHNWRSLLSRPEFATPNNRRPLVYLELPLTMENLRLISETIFFSRLRQITQVGPIGAYKIRLTSDGNFIDIYELGQRAPIRDNLQFAEKLLPGDDLAEVEAIAINGNSNIAAFSSNKEAEDYLEQLLNLALNDNKDFK